MNSRTFITEQNDTSKTPFSERERLMLDALIQAELQRDLLMAAAIPALAEIDAAGLAEGVYFAGDIDVDARLKRAIEHVTNHTLP